MSANDEAPAAPSGPAKNGLDSAPWVRELALAEKDLRKFWERGRRTIKNYTNEQDITQVGLMEGDSFNIFWSNVGVLKAALYANPPKPLVKREFDDFSDDVARVAATMMERLLRQGFDDTDGDDTNSTFARCVEDRLIPGLGQVWLRYCPDIEEQELEPAQKDRKGKVIKEALISHNLVDEEVEMDYVYWEDFWFSPARTWCEVRWVGRRCWMTRREFIARFNDSLAKRVSWTRKEPNKYGEKVTPDSLGVEKTEVFEIWHKPSKTAVWVSRSCTDLLDRRADPLELEGFFPCPKPLLATTTTSNLIPKNDYMMTQSQYRRLNNLSRRIGMLEDAIQASGVYDKANKELSQLLPGNGLNKMIPVDNWALFAERGGMKGVIDWFPLEMIINALDKLREMKVDAKAELYELTGISDIMRGQTNARETLGAQELKSQYSSVRLQYVQGEVAQFVQDALRIKAEIITKHFQLETIIRQSLIELTPDADMGVEAAQLLKDEWATCYRIKVFADSLALPDYNAERAARTEFISTMGQFVTMVMPLIQQDPSTAPFLLQILQWGIASFRSAATIEGVFDKFAAQIEKKLQAAAQQPPPPDPKMIKAQGDVQATTAKAQADVQATTAKAQAEIARKNAETATNAQRAIDDQQRQGAKTAAEISSIIAQGQVNVLSTHKKTQAQINASRMKTMADIAAKFASVQAKAKKGA